jgi:UDP-glucose 4-epimerase
MDYLVTGGAGFIGSHLVGHLLSRGDRVRVIDDLSTGSLDNLAEVSGHADLEIHICSVTDVEAVRRLARGADRVFHLAASVGVELILARPLDSLMNNIQGTEAVLEACEESGAKVLITSTSEIYGKNGAQPLSEEADRCLGPTTRSRWSYSTGKAVDEIMAFCFWRERGVRTIVARLFNTVGPRQTGTFGMVIPRLVGQALSGADLTVYGTGEQRRNFCHVADTVSALVALMEAEEAVGEVYNVGGREEVRIIDLARYIARRTGSRSRIVVIPYSEALPEGYEDMQQRSPDTSKLEKLTGWSPTRSLTDIVGDVAHHERLRLHRSAWVGPARPGLTVERPTGPRA